MAAEEALNALGNQTRRQIISFLCKESLSVGEIAARLPISRPAVSKHLRILETGKLVEYSQEGTRNMFRIKKEGFSDVRQWLDIFWDQALGRFALIAENIREEK